MGFEHTRSDGVKVTIVSIPANEMSFADYYQWGKNCANLEQTVEDANEVLVSFDLDFTSEESDEFWRGYHDNKIVKAI
jgi:hypothetical protein